eukprot:TRINITY_DN4777_c0_g1_i2.p1 TRINITY_DN4777_c0_g1~~TRINITY_DN4777_c0_g1_i2.p1  ORF type:complete len:103 (-),score=11.68 TRINITY_DN4777_c0_g1_i2:68-376(-)
MRATSAPQKTDSSWAFFNDPLFLSENVTCLAVAFAILLIFISRAINQSSVFLHNNIPLFNLLHQFTDTHNLIPERTPVEFGSAEPSAEKQKQQVDLGFFVWV